MATEKEPPKVNIESRPLKGDELLKRIDELGDIAKSSRVRACGYVTQLDGNRERLNFTAFYQAVMEAKGHRFSAEEVVNDVKSKHRLTGLDLLAKLAELGDVPRPEQVIACGYISRKKKNPRFVNTPRLDYTGFYKAVDNALGRTPETKESKRSKFELKGKELLQKVEELGISRKSDVVISCGYTSRKKDGSERLHFQKFYSALQEAQRLYPGISTSTVKALLDSLASEVQGKLEQSSLNEQQLESLRLAQRSRALERYGQDVSQPEAIRQNALMTGSDLVSFCKESYSQSIPETSICIRSGYSTDNIGQFRRAFSKAAEVPFGDLGRMITALNQQEEQAKERLSKYIENQEEITNAELPTPIEEEIEDIITERRLVEVRSTTRIRNTRFRNAVLKAHDHKCACCGIDIPELLEAAHIVPVANDGTDHPSNGIALCPTHHSAFDRHYFTFEPGSRKLILKAGLTTSQLLITKEILEADINDECLALRQRLFNTEASD